MIGDILQPTHLLLILVVALIVLGPKRLPETAKSLGRGIRDFRTALSGDDHESQRESLQTEGQQPAQPQQSVVADPQAAAPAPPAAAEEPQPEGPTQPVEQPQAEPSAQTSEQPQPISTGAPGGSSERSS